MRKQIMTALLTLSLVGTLSSCSLVGFWLSGCGGEKADLVVVNESSAVIDGISVTESSQTQSVSSEDGSGLLECGESWLGRGNALLFSLTAGSGSWPAAIWSFRGSGFSLP